MVTGPSLPGRADICRRGDPRAAHWSGSSLALAERDCVRLREGQGYARAPCLGPGNPLTLAEWECVRLRASPWSARGQQGRTRSRTRSAISAIGNRAGQHQVVLRIRAARDPGSRSGPAGGTRHRPPRPGPCSALPATASARIEIQHHGQVRAEVLGGPARHHGDARRRPGPDRRPGRRASSRRTGRRPRRARRRARGGPPRRRAGPCRRRRAAPRRAADRSPVAGSRTACRTVRPTSGVARFEGLHDRYASLGQPLHQRSHLGGLADRVAALEDDEQPGLGVHPGQARRSARRPLSRASDGSWPSA